MERRGPECLARFRSRCPFPSLPQVSAPASSVSVPGPGGGAGFLGIGLLFLSLAVVLAGNASTGNTQLLNGNSLARGIGLGEGNKTSSQGGDPTAKSCGANGGDGGDADAYGGDAKAGG